MHMCLQYRMAYRQVVWLDACAYMWVSVCVLLLRT